MIQTFTNAFKTYFTSKSKINYIIIFVFILLFTFFFFRSGCVNENNLKDVTTNLFPFSSIFSAILITFIISKIFQIRNEKIEIKKKVVILSNKVTNFRRICDKILNNYDIWDSTTKSRLENQYKKLKYQHLYDDFLKEKPKELIEKFNQDKNLKGAFFYLALRDLAKTTNGNYHLELYGEHDEDIMYSIEDVKNWVGVDCANSFFYYLEDKYISYKDVILLDNLKNDEKSEILSLANKINRDKYHGSDFSKKLLVNIGNDFQIEYLPKLLILNLFKLLFF